MNRVILPCLAVSLFISAALAQDPRGGIAGAVVDASNAVVPGVKIRATHMETGVSATGVSNQAGAYTLPYLMPGFYSLTAEQTGFKTFVRDRVEVRVGETVELPIRMEVGEVAERVHVTAETPVLETTSSSLGQVIDQRRISELPQRGANPLELALLTPGVVNATNLRLRKAMAPEATSQVAADGAGQYNNEFQIDGITNMSADRGRGYARVAFSPPASAVREFKMQTTAYDAAIGHTPGAVLNVSTASGANDFHGEAHYWLRHSALDAPNFFNNKNRTTPGVYQDNRYGGSVGGPVVIPGLYNGKNRTFWFYVYDGNKFGVPVQFTGTVPSAEQRIGDFSALLRRGSNYQIYDPATTRPAPGGRFSRELFPNNVIPRSRLDPVGVNLTNLYPLPTFSGTADGRNNFFFSYKALQDYYVHLLRLDHAFSENHRAFLRLHYDFWKEKKNNDFGNWINGIRQNRPNRGVAVDDVIVLNPNTVLNLRYGFTSTKWWQFRVTRGYPLGSLGFSPQLLSLLNPEEAPIPRITPSGYTVISRWENPGDGVNSSLTHSATANVTRLQGRHNLRFGTELRVYRSFNNRRPVGVAPDFEFGTTYTRGPLDNSPSAPIGQGLASMLLGIPDGEMEITASSALQDRYWGIYIHDDLKLTSKLSLNLGLRYELELPFTERYDRLVSGFDASTSNPIEAAARANYARAPIPELPVEAFRVRGGLTWVGQNGGRSPYAGEKNNILPRFGFAYQLGPSTVLRGGYGLFFDTIGINKTLPIQTGYTQSTPIQASLDSGQTYIANIANPFPHGLIQPQGPAGGLRTNLGQGLEFYLRDMKHSYSQRWSFGVQHTLPAQFLVETSYVGNRGTRIGVDRNINATPAQYQSTQPTRDQPVIDFLSQRFSNPFRGLDPIYGSQIPRSSLLRPYPQFGNIIVEEPIGYSWYHSLQVRSEKRFSHGYTFQLAYTWSKLMEATSFLNATDPLPYESIGALDRPHRLAASGIWEVPIGRGRRFGSAMPAALHKVIGDWQIGAVVTRQSGAPLGFGNAIFTGDIKDIALPTDQRTADRWFNTNAGFNRNSSQQLGSNLRAFPLRFSGVRSDGQSSWDFSIVKNIPVTETVRAQFRADAYNAWNQTNFNNPNTTPTNSSFGRITSTAGDARNWQLSLKLMF
ncbi:MAG: TonB-dependent receptor [Acidobacteria bacterium]|nr:TonB-dependent receptor [Acidobacteriota bacterium]